MKLLEGKTAIITGASRGIGKAIAIELAKYGTSVAINYNSNTRLAKDVYKKVGFIDHAFSHFTIRLNGYFCTEKKYFLKENENRKWILKQNIKNYSFPKANHKLFKQLELNNWYV